MIPTLGSGDLAISGRAADRGIASIHRLWDQIRRSPPPKDDDAHPLGWMQTDAYLELAQRAMADNVLAPLRDRGIPVGLSTDSVRAEEPVGLVGVDR